MPRKPNKSYKKPSKGKRKFKPLSDFLPTGRMGARNLERLYTRDDMKRLLDIGHTVKSLMHIWNVSKQTVLTLLDTYALPKDTGKSPYKTRKFYDMCYAWGLNAAEVVCLKGVKGATTDLERAILETRKSDVPLNFRGYVFPEGRARTCRELMRPSFLNDAIKYGFSMHYATKLTRYTYTMMHEFLESRELDAYIDRLLKNDEIPPHLIDIPEYVTKKRIVPNELLVR